MLPFHSIAVSSDGTSDDADVALKAQFENGEKSCNTSILTRGTVFLIGQEIVGEDGWQ